MSWELERYSISSASFTQLAILGERLLTCTSDRFESNAKFLRPYCIAYLDQTLRNHQTGLSFSSRNPEVNSYLAQCGFSFLPHSTVSSNVIRSGKIIRLEHFSGDSSKAETHVIDWIQDTIVPCIPRLAADLRRKIVKNFWEIVNNGLEHGEGNTGVSCCGQFYPRKGYFEAAFSDYGVGIPSRVRAFLKEGSIPDEHCINWAVAEGNSTKSREESAGLGLHLLRKFLTLNRGSLQIASGSGFLENSADCREFKPLQETFSGTLVNIRIIYDNNLYTLQKRTDYGNH